MLKYSSSEKNEYIQGESSFVMHQMQFETENQIFNDLSPMAMENSISFYNELYFCF